MGMTIDLAMNNLSGILTEATEDEDSVCYVTEDDAETLQVAINTMHKYQKIQEIVKQKDYKDYDRFNTHNYYGDFLRVQDIRKVIQYGNDD